MLGHAIRVLELFDDADRELALQQVTSRTGITKSSAYRILFTLDQLGYIDKDPASGTYRLGRRLFEMAGKARASRSIVQVAQPQMRALHQAFGETVNLAALQGGRVVYLDILEGSHTFRLIEEPGAEAPLHASALGKAVLAHQPDESARTLLAGVRFTRFTPRTIVARPALIKELERVRRQGFATDAEEAELGATCVAAHIVNAHGEATYAISVSGPTPRMRPRFDEVVRGVRAAADRISAALAGAPARP